MTKIIDLKEFSYFLEDKSTLFEKVDKALYLAKKNGRDRVEQSLISCVH